MDWFGYMLTRFSNHEVTLLSAVKRHKAIQAERLERFSNTSRPIWVERYEGMDAKWGVAKLKSPRKNKSFNFMGTGRCGTTYLAAVMKKIGIDVPHGKVGMDGTTGHYFIADSDWYPVITYNPDDVAYIGQRLSDYMFEKNILIIREPLATIRSLSIFMGRIDEDFYEDTGIVPRGTFKQHNDLIWRGMVLYYYINRYVLDNIPLVYIIQLEDFENKWTGLLDVLGLDYVELPAISPKNKMGELRFSSTERLARMYYGEEVFMAGYDAHPHPVTYPDLRRLDGELCMKIYELAEELGYQPKWSVNV